MVAKIYWLLTFKNQQQPNINLIFPSALKNVIKTEASQIYWVFFLNSLNS
ncbi:hypothetical protein FDUTEX481_03080 [Tolypothrix sp. PCC 7601]|nr:hypothetical protein FDUTEX481_03080 [Tolypothrix sp. PCC 7601]